ncbi:MAG: hypothetical protein HUJ26_20535 [Planctomycetaceae bacterium]|nr:hypothetical protein [Planctomycetaceae bacterium]
MDEMKVTPKIRTHEIEVVNKDGEVAIRMGTSPKGQPEIELLNTLDSIPRICMSVGSDRLNLSFLVEDGSTLLGLGVDEVFGGGLSLMNSDKNRMVMLSVSEDKEKIITVADT